MIDGRRTGEYLAMPDNGFGSRANSADFSIRAYYVRPHFRTADGGSGLVDVDLRNFISFRDPKKLIGFTIMKEDTRDRLLTGRDIDPESLPRANDGDYWMGEDFGPWILHFSSTGVLLDPPFAVPGGVRSPNSPAVLAGTATATHPNSRGIEAMAISPDGRYLYAALEGPTNADKADPVTASRRMIFEFSIRGERFTGRTWQYKTGKPDYMVADMAAIDGHRLVLIERDAGSGVTAVFRGVYVVDRDVVRGDGYLASTRVVDLAAIADPALVSLPAIHTGDIGLGNPFPVACESVEAIHPLDNGRILIGCDNNLPNAGRNPGLADDNEFIVIRVPGLGHGRLRVTNRWTGPRRGPVYGAPMTNVATHPEAILRHPEDLPFVATGDGNLLQLLNVDLANGVWTLRIKFAPGTTIQTHQHTGAVHAFTLAGRWYYLEYPNDVNTPGSYLFEPAGSVHTLHVPVDNTEATDVWFTIHGANLNMDADGNIVRVSDAHSTLARYRELCAEQHDLAEPPVVVIGL